jgi:hypothetical protein
MGKIRRRGRREELFGRSNLKDHFRVFLRSCKTVISPNLYMLLLGDGEQSDTL